METLRLRTIQQPSKVEGLLESFISHTELLPQGARRVSEVGSVPKALRGPLTRAIKQGNASSCWVHGNQIWLFVAEMSFSLSRERGAPVLKINIYGGDGALQDSSGWINDRDGNWCRCAPTDAKHSTHGRRSLTPVFA